jgi:putative ABC transport system permease protein
MRPDSDCVVSLSHDLWQRRFGGEAGILGKALTLDGNRCTVVGIMPPRFPFPGKAELWAPLALDAGQAGRGRSLLAVIGRLKSGWTMEQARADMEDVARRLQRRFPQTNIGRGVTLRAFNEEIVGELRPSLGLGSAAAGVFLLIVCLNAAGLMFAGVLARWEEIAASVAPRAAGRRLLPRTILEGLLVCGAAGVAGVLAAWVALTRGLPGISPELARRVQDWGGFDVEAGIRMPGFGAALLLASTVICALTPVVEAGLLDRKNARQEGRRSGWGVLRLLHVIAGVPLVVLQIALALVLLIGAGLLNKSFWRLQEVTLGYDPSHVLTMDVGVSRTRYASNEQAAAFLSQVLQRIEALPGVRAAGAVSALPASGTRMMSSFTIEGRSAGNWAEFPTAEVQVISPGYFAAMSIPLRAGRAFSGGDTATAARVTVVDEALARRFFPGEQPIGKRLKLGPGLYTIIGLVGTVRDPDGQEPRPQVYFSYQQRAVGLPWYLVVRTQSDPMSLAAAVRREIWAVDPNQPVSDVRPMEEVVAESRSQWRSVTLLLSICAVLMFASAAIGAYGLALCTVTGVGRGTLLWPVLGGAIVVAVGIGLGLAAALASTRLLSSMLYQVRALDPPVFLVCLLVVGSVAALVIGLPVLAQYVATSRDRYVASR